MVAVAIRPDWDLYFLGIAEAVSARADCRRATIGCVIVDTQHRIVSTGYNGAPAGSDKSCLSGDCPRADSGVAHLTPDYSNCISIHAEANAIAYADSLRTRGSTIYFSGDLPPCDMCAKLLRAAGIARWVTKNEEESYW